MDPTEGPHWPHRVERVLERLTNEWLSFEEIYPTSSALDAKQHTGALIWLRNRRVVASRLVGRRTEWRLTGL